MAIAALPTPPSSARPSTFTADMDTFLAALPQFVTDANALATALNALTGQTQWAVAGGTADAITGVFPVTITVLTDGLLVAVRATAANATTTPTFKADGTTLHTITKKGGVALAAGDIPGALAELFLRYNLANTRWELLNPASTSEFTSGTFTVSDASGASLTFAGNSWFYRAHATFYAMWGELVWPSTANGAGVSLSGFPFTSKSNGFAISAWLTPCYNTNGGVAGSPYYLYVNQNASTGTVRDIGGVQPTNATFTTLRTGYNCVIPR